MLANRIRKLLDHLDALTEKLALKVTTALFDVLAHPTCLSLMLYLLADVSASSSPIMSDVRKSYRYPYVIANILAHGALVIRDKVVSSPSLVTHLLSFLDGNVVLSTASTEVTPEDNTSEGQASPQKLFTRENPVIIGNVVEILISCLETNPEPLLEAIHARPTFIPSLVNLLHIGSVPKLFAAIVLDRCVEDVYAMDLGNVSFDRPMSYALSVLADAKIFELLANAFLSATQSIYSLCERDAENNNKPELFHAEELSFNILQVYSMLVKKTIRAVRLQPMTESCRQLHVFANPVAASTVSHILKAGTDLFRGTGGAQVSTLNVALGLAIDILKFVEEDRERRVASVTGQPAPLDTSALEMELDPVLTSLIAVLIDIVDTGPGHGQIRLRILELFVECQRVCSGGIVRTLDNVRFGRVAVKIMLLHPQNSLMQHVVCRAVEAALISNASEAFARHWLVRSKLPQKIMRSWLAENGTERWNCPAQAQEAPFLSALVHMACCVEHWMALQRESRSDGGRVAESDAVLDFLSEDVLQEFEVFCSNTLHPIMDVERASLGGPRPRRRARGPGNTLVRSFGSFGSLSSATRRRNTSTGVNGRNRAHLVWSPSAHRFGYVATSTMTRGRLGNMFIEDDLDSDIGGFGRVGAATSFASIFDSVGDSDL